MQGIVVDAKDDPRIAPFLDLPLKGESRRTERFVVEGRWLVDRLLTSEHQVYSILCLDQVAAEFAQIASQIPVYVASRTLLDQIVGFDFHRGVLACGRRPTTRGVSELAPSEHRRALYAVCSGICDPANLGGIIRNCAAFGADALLIDDHCADPFSRRVLRVSMGAALSLTIVESADLIQDIQELKRDWGFEVVSTTLSDSAVPIDQARTSDRDAIAFGNEGYGLSKEWEDLSDQVVKIPMAVDVDSLNVAVASGIFLYKFSQTGPQG